MRSSGPSYWDDAARHGPLELFWLSDPSVRRRVNRRVSGDASAWPITWFGSRAADRLPFEEALSVGCGVGALERELVRSGMASRVTGVDLVAGPLAQARRAAELEAMAARIRYVQADARDLLLRPGFWDAVFFHGSLHHFEDVGEVLELARAALKPGGILYLDEYVGRSRTDWRWWHLLLPNLAYRLLPRSVRRTRVIRSPITGLDPTEQVRSADILPSLKRRFQILERKDYGGNLLLLVYPSLKRPGPGGPTPGRFEAAVERLLSFEDLLLRHSGLAGWGSFHTVLWAEPKPVHSHSIVAGGLEVTS